MDKIRNQSFPFVTMNDWKEKSEQSLKAKKVESLQSSTYENIILKPLYFRDDELDISQYPGGADFRRGTNHLGYITNDWKVSQKISYDDPKGLKGELHHAFEKGQTALSFEITKDLLGENGLSDLLNDFYKTYPFAINAEWMQGEFLAKLADQLQDKEDIAGYIANDPISLFAKAGFVSEEVLHSWMEDIKRANDNFPNLRTILVDTVPYHNGGANAVQELGIGAAAAVFYLQQALENGFGLGAALSKIQFQFSIGSNFFMELAKLRAARVLWNRITELYGAEEKHRGINISAVTSTFTKTVFDPHVNILRNANEAFAAVLGGVQFLHVAPFDELTGATAFSERVARNIQLILKEEAHLQKVIDPAGGSWYIETLTNQLAEMAWAFFQEIDANGGIINALKSGWLQERIAAIFDRRTNDFQTRKQSIVGTNVYAKLDERPAEILSKTKDSDRTVNPKQIIMPIPQKRLSEPFEELRFKARILEKRIGSNPAVGMLCLGELKQYKARLDFMNGFLAAGGINTNASKPIFTVEDAREFVENLAVPFVCLCGTNEQYETFGHGILNALKAEFPDLCFYMAGLPAKENQSLWIDEGVVQFIHVRSNCYETASAILTNLEVSHGEQSKA